MDLKIIAHRINKIEQLQALPNDYGAEVDIRSKGSQLSFIMTPFQMEKILKNGSIIILTPLILNVKKKVLNLV